ncbi:hypothetical protein BC832DRAFT_590838 [Gaertneriomyces semiglobifer]|nr:hypothetical protein BC832DRAFT_590838 [Gaertneriomyces semiglobifer]
MLKLCDVPDTGLFVAPGFEFWAEKPETWEDPWFSRFIPKYRVMNESELPPTCSWGIAYETVCINVPRYLKWLTEKFRYLGGTLKHEDTTRIEDLIDAETEVIVNCTGYGARFLGGVEDANVYPTRGQVVWVHAPQVRHTVTRLGTVHEDFTYIIPRDDGIVVLGGTYQANDDTLQPDPETSEAIIERCLSICPELKVNGKLDIVKHKAGLRPTRVGGVRCEAEWRSSGNGRRALIVHNYGHGGYGYQASYGCAQSVLAIVEAEMGGKGHHSTSIAKL